MISKQTIKKYGLDTDSLKALFTADKPNPGVKRLVNVIADRIREGRLRNFADYRVWAAVDMSYDAPFSQTTATLVRNIMDTCHEPKEMMEALSQWGLSLETLFSCEKKITDGKASNAYSLNVPVFTNVFVPLVRAYLVIRLSKIFNDRNKTPLFNYPPLHYTSENRILCEIVTDVVESIATNFGYSSVLRDFIFNALMYSVAIKFPVEPWTVEKQEGSNGEEYIEKEGVRYVVPHITRTFYDLNFPLHTLNTGTGCSFAGYWTVLRWGSVADCKEYWNMDMVPHGENWLDKDRAYHNYFTEVYPCTLEAPKPKGTKRTDREDMVARYSKTDYDSAFFVTYMFMELIPSEWGLGKYENKVWIKFTIGSDSTVMYAETFPYRPIDYIGYDADSGRGRNASLALEIIPFQDLAGNALTQFLLTIKRNLTNVIFYNKEAIDGTAIEGLNKKSQSQFSQLNFIGFDGLKMERAGVDMGNVFKAATFPFADPSQVLLSLNTIISVLERVLVVAAQEIGASASHQQSKKEVEIANANTSNRVSYTASFVDEGIEAWKRQLWDAAMAHMDGNEVVASVSADIPNLDKVVKELGFEFAETPVSGQKKVSIKGKIKTKKLIQLAARRSDVDRSGDAATAQAMFAAISAISNSQTLSQIVDPASLVLLVETAAKLAGADEDFKVALNKDSALASKLQEVVQQIQQQIEQKVMQGVETSVTKPVAEAMASQSKEVQQNTADIQALTALLEKIQSAAAGAPQQQVPPQPMVAQPPMIDANQAAPIAQA